MYVCLCVCVGWVIQSIRMWRKMNSSPDIYENGRPELVEWELFQIVLDLTFLKKERIPTKIQTPNFELVSLESRGYNFAIKFVD